MTSPNFSYPQPTDDELAAQMPAGPSALRTPAPPVPGPVDPVTGLVDPVPGSAVAGAPSPRLGKWALGLTLGAAALSLIASMILGATAGPAEAANGRYFSDAPAWLTVLGTTLFALQGLCTLAGLSGLVMGIIATATDRGRTQGIIATAVAIFTPVISFALFLVLSFALV
ncbi:MULTISPECIES: hypothetical protein [unclassified Brevibacterium]|uniref:hypothetical protein n=1 Tax=unclassified Brevibacterium TaxID=2614124 RepID=UPI0010FA340D|nr:MULTISPECIES: hypothetical protein [unclassified Brevibacterium]MCM1012996.1 hypothetical protein [Brevibacterium sp. XM4083]